METTATLAGQRERCRFGWPIVKTGHSIQSCTTLPPDTYDTPFLTTHQPIDEFSELAAWSGSDVPDQRQDYLRASSTKAPVTTSYIVCS